MPHAPYSPPLIDTDGSLRLVLERADSFPPMMALPTLMPLPTLSRDSLIGARAALLMPPREVAMAFGFGFVVSLAVVLFGMSVQPVPSASMASSPVATDRPAEFRTAAFAVPALASAHAVPAGAASLLDIKVASEINGDAGQPLPLAATVVMSQQAPIARVAEMNRTRTAPPVATRSDLEPMAIDGRPLPAPPTRYMAAAGPEIETAGEENVTEIAKRTATPAFTAPPPVAPAGLRPAAIIAPQPVRIAVVAPTAPAAIPRPVLSMPSPKPIARTTHTANPVATAKVAKVAAAPAKLPPKPIAEPKAIVARATKPKHATPPRAATPAPEVAEAPAVISPGQPLPWSYRWTRSALGMGQGGR